MRCCSESELQRRRELFHNENSLEQFPVITTELGIQRVYIMIVEIVKKPVNCACLIVVHNG